MLWYKAWLETRWRFLIGLLILMCSACATVITYPQVVRLLPMVPDGMSGEVGRQVRESAELARTFRGYVWSQWFLQNMPQLWLLFAVLLGTGGLLSRSMGGGTLFTLSLPISRDQLLRVRVATALAELAALAFVPSLLIALLAPSIGSSYGIGDVLVHGACIFIAGSVFFSLALLLSTAFSDLWRPPLIALCVALLVGLVARISPDLSGFDVFRLMSAEVYFRHGVLPWLGLLVTAALSVTMIQIAGRNIARRDF